MSDLNLLHTEVEDDLRAVVRKLLASRCDATSVAAMYDGDRSFVRGLWEALACELGLAGLLVPEERGGAGATALEAAVVLEELGRAVAPVPFLTSAVVATTALREAEGGLLGELASGEVTAALAVPLSTAPNGLLSSVGVVDGRLTGTITSVAGAIEADVLLVLGQDSDGLTLYSVAAADAAIRPLTSLDMTRQLADVILDEVPGTAVVFEGEAAVRDALAAGAALMASEQLGLAQWCLETTIAYLKERRQFGRPVGGFQALKHRLADLAIGVESGIAVARYAAATLAADDDDQLVAGSLAQAYVSDLAVAAAEEAIQLHAGIGMTWEHPAHLYLKRAKANQIAIGTAGAHRARLAELVDLPGPW